MPDDSAAAEGTGETASDSTPASEPNASQRTPPPSNGNADPPESNPLKSAQAEAASWRGRYRELQGKYDSAIADAQRKASDEVTAYREKLVRAEVRAVAAGRLADPTDALKFVDDSSFVNTKGEVDHEAITKSIDELLASKPYLAMSASTSNSGNGHGSADQGARGGKQPPATAADAMNTIIRGGKAKR